jgi:hypothetical protein
MHTVPAPADSDNLSPSLNDLHTDANVQTSAVIDCIDAYFDADDWVTEMERHFGYDQPMSDADLDECYAAAMADAPAAKWQPFELDAPQTLNTIVRMPEAWGQRKAVSL